MLSRLLTILCLCSRCGRVLGGERESSCTRLDTCDASATSGHALLQSSRNLADASQVIAQEPAAEVQVGTGKRNTSTFFYHVHVPRTGGSTVANLLMADICNPFDDEFTLTDVFARYGDLCTKKCEYGLTENELSCYRGRINIEHDTFAVSDYRARSLQALTGAERIVYVTTLRRGSDRVLSQWSHEVKHDRFIASSNPKELSNQSLREFLIGGPGHGSGWHGRNSPSQRNNLQVAQLASMNNTMPGNVTREHLEKAKSVLMNQAETWLIGFTDCMDKVHEKLMDYGDELFGSGSVKRKALPQQEVHTYSSSGHGIVLDEETSAMLKEYTALDNELFEWAWEKAATDSRFAGTC